MAIIAEDLVAGNEGRKTKDGWELVRIFTVTLAGGDPDNFVKAAILEVIAEIGDINSSHTSNALLLLKEFRGRATANDTIEVEAIYREEEAADDSSSSGSLNIGTVTSQTESNTDYQGNLIVLDYTYPSDYKLDDRKRGHKIYQGGMVMKMVPESTIHYRRRESSSPASKSRTYAGTVNVGGWSLDPSAAPRTWFCATLTGDSNDGGASYMVDYIFRYRAGTWDETVLFINPDDGKPPQDVEEASDGTGSIQTIQIYSETEFDNLNL